MEKLGDILSKSQVIQDLAKKYNIDMEKVRAHRAERLERYREIYSPEITEVQAFEIERAERVNAICAKCTGFPCDNGGFYMAIRPEDNYMPRYVICDKRRQYDSAKRQARLFAAAKIPALYLGKGFSDYSVDSDNKVAVAWAKSAIEKVESLYISGAPGTGKTFLAAIMAQEYLKRGDTVIFADVPSLLADLRGTFDKDSDLNIEDLMKELANVDVLVLDDLGTEQPTIWSIERLYMVINERYNSGKAMIITSNYDLGQAEAILNRPKDGAQGITGSRIVSRLNHCCRVIKLKGNDRRK